MNGIKEKDSNETELNQDTNITITSSTTDVIGNVEKLLYINIECFSPLNLPLSYIEDITKATNSGFGINLDENDIKNHLFKSDKIYVIKNNDKIIGFTSIKIFNDFIYRFGTSISKDFHGKGVYKLINRFLGLHNGFLRTQNLNVINSLKKSGFKVLIGKEAYDHLIESICKEELHNFFLELGDNNDTLINGVFRGVYGGKMGIEGNVSFIDDLFYRGFNAEEGDSLLIVYYVENDK